MRGDTGHNAALARALLFRAVEATATNERGLFTASCRHCGHAVVRDVAQLRDAELDTLRSHVLVCCPTLVPLDVATVETLFRHVTVVAGRR
jgi:hypothetical protein